MDLSMLHCNICYVLFVLILFDFSFQFKTCIERKIAIFLCLITVLLNKRKQQAFQIISSTEHTNF